MSSKSSWNNTKRILIILVDVVLFNFSILIGFWIKFGMNIPERNYVSYEESAIYLSVFFIILNLLLGTYIFYNRIVGDIIFVTIIGQILMSLTIMMVSFAGRWFAFPRSVLLYSFISSLVLLSLWRIIVYLTYIRFSDEKKIAIVGDEKKVLEALGNFSSNKNQKHKVSYAITNHYAENVAKILADVDIVYLSGRIEESEKSNIYDMVIREGKKLFLTTSFENLIMLKPNMMNFEDESIIEVSDFNIPSEEGLLKRLFDILVSSLLLLVTSPIMLVTTILIKATSPGPVIYKQTRITLDQKEFSILKFRTMSATAEAKSGPVLSTNNDNRVTGIGKYLRALRIDELPQLLNVLGGDMSVVGPRPERPFFVNQFNQENPYYYLRHNVRAGITGYAQVYGKYASDYNSKLNFDLLYIKNYSILLDLKILLQTIKILFDKVSSQGVEEEESMKKNELSIKSVCFLK
ncbi:sugar transferase [Enterococcus hulanensis]|uniref:sugar transferase n=1 Tax=Enterococcus hulanensis TaxID=2559929 RepID=UPI001A8DC23C|nr:sugar transferase [Enterococcus hulanensis]MBO0459367.1 sugar transferase [Enterococcus hulanensis]